VYITSRNVEIDMEYAQRIVPCESRSQTAKMTIIDPNVKTATRLLRTLLRNDGFDGNMHDATEALEIQKRYADQGILRLSKAILTLR